MGEWQVALLEAAGAARTTTTASSLHRRHRLEPRLPRSRGSPGTQRHDPWHPTPMPPPQLSPPAPPALLGAPPEFVEHQARKVKNDVNLHERTIRLMPEDADPDRRLIAFTFDAVTNGRVTIYYFVKEEKDCSFASVYSELELQIPTKIPF